MRSIVVVCLLFILAFATGCTSLHPDPPRLSHSIKARLAPPFFAYTQRTGEGNAMFTARREATNKAVADILKIKQVTTISKKKPLTIAVAEVGLYGLETIRQEDKDAWRKELEETGLVKVIFISSVILSANPQFSEIRLAAARLHADVMLLYTSVNSVEKKLNLGAILYLTVVGIFASPGSEAAVLTFTKGACFDVENEFLQFTMEGEDERSTTTPYGFLDVKQLKVDSKKSAVDILRGETVRALKARAAK